MKITDNVFKIGYITSVVASALGVVIGNHIEFEPRWVMWIVGATLAYATYAIGRILARRWIDREFKKAMQALMVDLDPGYNAENN